MRWGHHFLICLRKPEPTAHELNINWTTHPRVSTREITGGAAGGKGAKGGKGGGANAARRGDIEKLIDGLVQSWNLMCTSPDTPRGAPSLAQSLQ